ncbi:hypothetical protein LDL76_13490 [Salegentibacter mishustinae]|uniref:hypothetical protein n=1 Tax=Salegentibacter mishustinae TaxID=270918 RepID=UPI001CE04EB0|nr:hypothetical protein [Salegentibacter mishustinae]UBZ06368.1 hypothetical protein LDL76_13490 [Salegentibacter mishustinae]
MKKKNLFKTLIIVAFLSSTGLSMLSAQQDQKNSNYSIENELDGSVNLTTGKILKMSGEEIDSYATGRINYLIKSLLSNTYKNGNLKSKEKLQNDYNVANYMNKIFFKDNILGQSATIDQFNGKAYPLLMSFIGSAKKHRKFDQILYVTIIEFRKLEKSQKQKRDSN